MVEVEWRLTGNRFDLLANVPNGVAALVKLPDGSEHVLRGSGKFQTVIGSDPNTIRVPQVVKTLPKKS
jgi:hypothetical protein